MQEQHFLHYEKGGSHSFDLAGAAWLDWLKERKSHEERIAVIDFLRNQARKKLYE